MISLDAIKGLLAEQWNKDIKDMIAKLRATGMVDTVALTAEGTAGPPMTRPTFT